MHATNLTDRPIQLLDLKLSRPRGDQEATLRLPPVIPPGEVLPVSVDLILNGAVSQPGEIITATLAIGDQFGRWYKVRFKRLKYVKPQPRKIISSPQLKGQI